MSPLLDRWSGPTRGRDPSVGALGRTIAALARFLGSLTGRGLEELGKEARQGAAAVTPSAARR
ncbi:hypothetical protein [Benzoatithermus flavus]|uniref:Uncharacterized protein n=1 Tax=Benzoatithermus flavus TaxID=3108223 RepID=A0ABU8XPT7_9PROT